MTHTERDVRNLREILNRANGREAITPSDCPVCASANNQATRGAAEKEARSSLGEGEE